MDIRVTTEISTEPVLKAEMRSYLKFKDTDTVEDTLITEMIKQARILLENRSNLSFAAKTLQVLFRAGEVMNDSVVLPFAPLISITTVKAVDTEGNKTGLTLNSTYFKRGLKNIELFISFNGTGIGVGSNLSGSDIEVIYVCGFGHNDTETLPATWKGLIMKQVNEWYNNREDYDPANLTSSISHAADSLTNNTWL